MKIDDNEIMLWILCYFIISMFVLTDIVSFFMVNRWDYVLYKQNTFKIHSNKTTNYFNIFTTFSHYINFSFSLKLSKNNLTPNIFTTEIINYVSFYNKNSTVKFLIKYLTFFVEYATILLEGFILRYSVKLGGKLIWKKTTIY